MEKNTYSDISKENKLTLICMFVSWIVECAIGIGYYWTNQNNYSAIDVALFFGLIFVPWIISVEIYKRNNNSDFLRKFTYSFAVIFYIFLIFTGKPVEFTNVILPIMMSTIVYCDPTITLHFGSTLVAVGVVGLIFRLPNQKDDPGMIYAAYAFAEFAVTTIFLWLGTIMMKKGQERRRLDIERERNRFKAIVSVGIERIFEYNIADDIIMMSESSGGSYGKERYLCNFSTVAKSKDYVPFSDWYRFDEILFEIKTGSGIIEKEIRVRNEYTNEHRWYRVKGRVIFDNEGVPEKVMGTLEDIEDAKKLEMRLADEKMRDPITKLYKKSYLVQFIDEYFAKNRKDKCAFIILDVDGYKRINEEMGTVFGDEILKIISEDIKGLFSDSDLMGRVGNDEFVILMKEIEKPSDIESRIKDIQRVIATTYIGERDRKNCTVSIGASVWPTDGECYEELYIKAEKALNLAQSKGPSHYDIYNPIKESVYSILAHELAVRQSRMMEEEHSRNYVSDSIIELAFKLIDESKDTDSAINLLIRQMCRQMNLSAIVVRSKVKDEKAMRVMYSYGVESTEDSQFVIKYDDAGWEANLKLYEKDNIGICRSINEVEDETLKQYMMALGIEAFIGCPFYERGAFAGTIDFLDMENERDWTDEEIKDIKSVTNVVSAYLLKMKAYEDASETVERLTGYDPVTGLYKYEKFLKLAGEYISTAEHGNYAIAYMDIFHFKYLNDTYGYDVGDEVLVDMARMINSYSEYVVMASRVFSDNMVVLLKLVDTSLDVIKKRIEDIMDRFSEEIRQRFSDSRLEAGVGVCTFTISGAPVMIQNIISNANMARKRTKLPMMPRCIFYDEQMGSAAKNEIAFANDMENAVKNHEFVIFLQPKVNLKNNKIEGAEALVRWKKADGSIIYPNDFIPVFERNKSITVLDFYVYEEVFRYIRGRMDAGLELINVSVNVSRVHLYAIDAIIDKIKELIDKYQVPTQYLEFELTETSFTDKVDDTITLMSRLRELGVKVSLDDFGAGYSSLNVLTKLPLDVLKIDKEFLKDFETDSEEKIVIPSVIAMAKKLNLDVVCEGVETIEQVKFLKEINCDYAQGYYYSKPVPQEEFDRLLEG